MKSKLIGLFLLFTCVLTVSVIFYPPATKSFARMRVTLECGSRIGSVESCSQFAETLINSHDYANASVALESNCKVPYLKSCYRLAYVLEQVDDIDRANLFYEFSCQSGVANSCEAYGQFLAGPALGRIDGVPSMKVACTSGDIAACAFVAAASYASGNNREAFSYWSHICQKLAQTNFCVWGAKKFEEKGLENYEMALYAAACSAGNRESCDTMKIMSDQKARIIQAQNEAKAMAQKRFLASLPKKKTSHGLPRKLPIKKRR